MNKECTNIKQSANGAETLLYNESLNTKKIRKLLNF